MKAVFVEQPGGVENLKHSDIPKPSPGPGQALVKIAASGVNYIDIYFRKGVYPAPPPVVLGSEGAGTVESVAPDVQNVKPGRSGCLRYGSRFLRRIPRGSGLATGKDSFVGRFRDGCGGDASGYDRALSHPLDVSAQARRLLFDPRRGGRHWKLIVQMAKMLGAHVTGTVGSEEKAKQAKEAGADEVIIYTKEDFAAKAKGMHVVYDSVGQSTFMKSLDCLRPRGMMVSFGNASGAGDGIFSAHSQPEGFAFPDAPDLGELLGNGGGIGLARQRRAELGRHRVN